MIRTFRIVTAAAAILLSAAPLAAQGPWWVVSIYGGGSDHLADLAPGATTWFMPGYSVGASVGLQLTDAFAVHGDFTYTRNPTEGSGTLAGRDFNRFFYGAHAELRYRMPGGLAPFIFAGAGGVSIDQLGLDSFEPTTRPALMYGGGIAYGIPRTRLDVFGEVKGLTYRWNMAGYHRNMVDVTYTGGISYRFPL